MIQAAVKNWWLLGLCGVLEAIASVIYFDHSGRGFSSRGALLLLARVILCAGACALIAAALRIRASSTWLVLLHGLGLTLLGLTFNGTFGPRIAFRLIAFLVILIALSIGALELGIARKFGREIRASYRRLLEMAGWASVAFALVFAVLSSGVVRFAPGSNPELIWLGSFFGFSALCMLGLPFVLQDRAFPACV